MNHFFPDFLYNKLFWLIVSGLFLSACAGTAPHQAYEGSAKPDNEVATFTIPDQYNLLSIDGTHFRQNIIKDGAIVKLLPGSHQLMVEYQDFWNLNGEQHEKVTSKPMAFTFAAVAGTQYSINSAPLESVEQARTFAEKPSITVINTANNQEVPTKIKYNLYGKGLFATLFGTPKSESTIDSSNEATTDNQNNNALEKLKVWWGMADKKQQDDFRQWLDNR